MLFFSRSMTFQVASLVTLFFQVIFHNFLLTLGEGKRKPYGLRLFSHSRREHLQPLQWYYCPLLWARQQHSCLSRSGPGFDLRSGQVSWVRFFRGFSSPVRWMSGSFRPSMSPNIIWPSLSSSLILHYGRQWPEMLTRPKNLKYTYNDTTVRTPEVPLVYASCDVITLSRTSSCFTQWMVY